MDGGIIKSRAKRLRDVGQRQVTTHLKAQIGKTHRILMENPRMGRTEQFAEVSFSSDQPESKTVDAQITGIEGSRLVA